MQITCDISQLSKLQREALAAFVLTFPDRYKTSMDDTSHDEDAEAMHTSPQNEISKLAFHIAGSMATADIGQESDPMQAFGPPAPEQAHPLPQAHVASIQPKIAPPPPPAQSGPQLVPPSFHSVPTDAEGLPWDARIHAQTKTKTQQNVWKMKRGVDDATVAKIKAELKQLMAIPAQIATQPASAANPSVPVPPTLSNLQKGFVDLMTRCSLATHAGKISQDTINAELAFVGVGNIQLLATRLDLVPLATERLDAVLTKVGA